MDASITQVSVFVRCRPLSGRELLGRRCALVDSNGTTIRVGDKTFTFEHVFDEKCSQEDIYKSCVNNLVKGCFDGYNGTIFAYGQTGSGKTYSIVGTVGVEEEEGVIPRAIKDIFHTLRTEKAPYLANYSIRVSMLEIYNDDVRDLLHPDIASRDIAIREDKDGRIFFTGAREEAVADVKTALFYLEQGNLNRSTAETLMNVTSSRSHAVFTIALELLEFTDTNGAGAAGAGSFVQAKLHLVDLAGSERAKRTGALGTRLKESVGINQGLLSLGKVIRALTSHPIQHVPYRESKLTRFLQDSLGGNSRTVMLACVSTAESNLHETLGTLQYAARAKAVQNKVSANVAVGVLPTAESEFQTDMESSVIVSLRAQIAHLKEQMGAAQTVRPLASMGIAGTGVDDPALVAAREELQAVNKSMQRVLRVNGRIQHTLREHLRHLETSGAHNAQACGPAWGLVNVCDTVVRTLEELQQQHSAAGNNDRLSAVRSSSAALRTSLRDSLSHLMGTAKVVPDLSEEVEALRQELQECREDLQRDEDIFAEKIKELKRCRKRIRELEGENKELSEKHQAATAQVQKLAENLLRSQRRAERRVAQGEDGGDGDDLDISVAVAVTEPDISQLMEDLETIVREKEGLLADNQLAEERAASAATKAQQQRDEFVRGQAQLRAKLAELEEGIRAKEREIGELSAAQTEAHRAAQQYQQRVREVEEESLRLQARLRDLDSARQLTAEEASEERQRRREYEMKLRAAEDQLVSMEREHQAFIASERQRIQSEEKTNHEQMQAAEQLRELENYRAEYARLTAQIEQAESKQRKTLEQMAHQISQYQKKAADSQAQIRQLEDKNVELRNRLERYAKARRKNGYEEPASPSDGGSADAAEGKTDHEAAWREAKTAEAKVDKREAGRRKITPQEVTTWLQGRLGEMVDHRQAKAELLRLQQVQEGIQQERANLLAELTPLRARQDEACVRLRTKIAELKQRIGVLKERRTVVRRRIEAQGEDGDLLREQLEEIEEELVSCDQHREDYEERLQQGGLEPSQLEHLQDLSEELETLDTESDLNLARIAHEKLRLGKAESRGISRSEGAADIWRDFQQHISSAAVQSDSAVAELVTQLLSMAVQHRTESADSTAAVRQLQQQLDDKTAECDETVRNMHKMRAEAQRRLEQQRRESEDKIAFLLNQLRAAEARRAQDDHMSAASSAPRPPPPGESVRNNLSRPVSAASTGDARRVLENSSFVLRGSGHFRTPTDAQLLEIARQDASGLNKELERRWVAEKERREQLERRTTDMARELRQLKQGSAKP